MNRMARPARIVVIDRPGPQSLILAGQTLGVEGTDDPLTLITANEVLGGSFVSRLNMDLREAKGWSYGVGTQVRLVRETVPFLLFAPVQTDRTGDSVKALIGVRSEEHTSELQSLMRNSYTFFCLKKKIT